MNKALIRLGGGTLFLDALQSGHLAGPVTLRYQRRGLRFPPSDPSLNNYDGVFKFYVDEEVVLKCSQAEISTQALTRTMGLDSGDASVQVGNPSYNPASFSAATAGTSYDMIKFGHNAINTDGGQAVMFQHTGCDGLIYTIILYKAFCRAKFDQVFDKRDIVLQDCEWYAVADNTRDLGDRVGMILMQR